MADSGTGDVGGLLQLNDPALLLSVGLGLMSGARYGSNAGEGMMQGLQMYSGLKGAQLQRQLMGQQIQSGNIANQRQQMMLGAAQQALQGDQGAPPQQSQGGGPSGATGGGALQTPFIPGISPMPAGGTPASATPSTPQGLPSGLAPPSMSQIYGTTYPGSASPNYMRAMAMFSQDPSAALLKFRDDQLKGAQQQYAPTIARLDQLIKSDAPAKYMNGTGFQDLKAAWPQLASTLGMDPDKDYNDQNVRLALSHVRNQLASSLQEPTSEPSMPLRTIRLQDGRMAQVEPGTGKITPIASEDLEKVIGQNGQPTLVPRSQAAGMTPFNQSIFGASTMDDQTKELAYQFAKANGGKLPPWMNSRGDAAKGAMANYIAQRASQEGLSGASMVAQGQATQAAGNVLKDFTSGATNKKLVAINTGVEHLDALNPLIDAMGTGNLTLINKARQFFEKQTGQPAPTNYSTLANMAVGEVSQAVMSGGGTGPERDELAAPFKSSNSPDVLRGAVKTAITALAGKTDGLRTSWDAGTNGTQGPFERFLGPATKKALGLSQSDGTVGSTGVTLNPGQSHSVGGFTVTRVN